MITLLGDFTEGACKISRDGGFFSDDETFHVGPSGYASSPTISSTTFTDPLYYELK
jgi:hypothetical protein